MKIICAGLSKTGTKSLAEALRILGFIVHDFDEHIWFYGDEYNQAIDGQMPDFAAMYKNVDAVVDDPPYFFWKEIKESFPTANVILTERDNAEIWADSLIMTHNVWDRTVQSQLWSRLGMLITPTGRKWSTIRRVVTQLSSSKEGENRKAVMAQRYLTHNSRVKALVPRDQLLVFNVKQGWKPLCEFLGVDVPDVPFPRLNVKSRGIPDMINQSMVGNRVFNELMLIVTVVFIIVAMFVFM